MMCVLSGAGRQKVSHCSAAASLNADFSISASNFNAFPSDAALALPVWLEKNSLSAPLICDRLLRGSQRPCCFSPLCKLIIHVIIVEETCEQSRGSDLWQKPWHRGGGKKTERRLLLICCADGDVL